jgi:ribosomal protein S18 acetylase RimI-like enzyme
MNHIRPSSGGVMLSVSTLQPHESQAAKALIIAGLTERWGRYDPTHNPDLVDFPNSYRDGQIRVARQGVTIVGVGILIPFRQNTAQIVRMSTAIEYRRQGVGRAILHELIRLAANSGFKELMLETTSTWDSAVAFYEASGFRKTHVVANDTYFSLCLQEA